MKITIFFLLLLSFAQAQAGQFIFRPELDIFQSANYDGYLASVQGQYHENNFDYLLGGRHLSRSFKGGTDIEENAFDIGTVYKINRSFYLEDSFSYAPDADILPETSISLTPHWVAGRGDMGLGFNLNHYKHVDAGYVHPSYLYELSDQWRVAGGLYFVRTDTIQTAYQGSIGFNPTSAHSIRLDGATGATLEDAGVEAYFNSLSLEYGYHWSKWAIFFSTTDYHSDIRKETSFGLRLEIR